MMYSIIAEISVHVKSRITKGLIGHYEMREHRRALSRGMRLYGVLKIN